MNIETVEQKPLVIDVDGVRTIDFEVVEEKYGSELVEKLEHLVDFYNEKGREWRLEIIEENKHFVELALSSRASVDIYEILLSQKIISSESHIGYLQCEKALELMNSFKK
jgi:hypothetical protein